MQKVRRVVLPVSLDGEVFRILDNNYMVSSFGRVFSRRFGKYLNPTVTNRGYMVVNLTTEGKAKQKFVHQLVAICFIPNPDNKRTIDHIDGNKLNNLVDNLRWATPSENLRYYHSEQKHLYD
jgi:hypothetical protein